MVLKAVIRRRLLVLGLIIFVLISGSFALACAAEDESAIAQSIRREVEQKYLEDAISAFKAGDYGRARNVFEMLTQSARSPEIGRQALFGLASVKLVAARTSEEYEDAFAAWQKWSVQAGPAAGCEDPRMLTPFLLKLEPAIEGAAASRLAGQSGKEVDTRGILQTKEKEMQSLRAKLDQREREIRRLRLQLESLENIHREYQEKKQEATPVTPAPPK
jgi:hypothetical protein